MFTGIIIEMGQIKKIQPGAESVRLTIKGQKVIELSKIGDSIAVNGVCLTVTQFEHDSFSADVMPETVRRTDLRALKIGDFVNLEPALRIGDSIGGHMVSGHVDGVGRIVTIRKEDNALWFAIEAHESVLNYIVTKGSVALDGISLTVAEVDRSTFSVSLIPHTASVTTFGKRKIGDLINIETDMIGKYIEKYVAAYQVKKTQGVTMDLLEKNGFI